MAAPFIIPFNQQPASVNVRVASYTIPAGRYAKAYCYFTGSGSTTAATYTQQSATVNGTSVLWESYRVNRSVNAQVVSFTFPSTSSGNAYIMISAPAGSFAYTVSHNGFGIANNITSAYLVTFSAPIAGGEISQIADSANNGTQKNFYISFSPIRQSFESWVPTGTILSGTGAYAWFVEEFNMIS